MHWLFLLLGVGAVALGASKSSATPARPGDDAALAADLAEIPDPVLREQVLKLLFTASPVDAPALETLAATLDAKGYKRAAARIRAKIAQLKGGPQAGAGGNPTGAV